MIMIFFHSLFINASIFVSSILTSTLFCNYFKCPFINPSNNKQYINNVIKSFVPIFTQSLFVTCCFYKYIDTTSHSLFYSGTIICIYALFVELFYYCYHKLIHHRFLYKFIHSKHHESIIVYPFDSFHLSIFDAACFIIILNLPVLILNMNFIEYFFCYYFYITFTTLSHSTLIHNTHAIHHKLFNYNFCLIIPIFDMLFSTYKH
jgi:lathosterol oxidase